MANKDWTVKVGFDASDVIRGKKKIDALMAKMERAKHTASRGSSEGLSRQEKQQKKLLAIDKKREQAQQTLLRLKHMGVDKREISSIQNKINSTRTLASFDRTILEIRKRIRLEREKELKLAQQAATVKQPSSVRRVFAPERIKRRAGLESLDVRARTSLARLPQGQMFESQRRSLQDVINQIQRLDAAYAKVGTKSSLGRLNAQMVRLRSETTAYVSAANSATRQMNAQQFAAGKLKNSIHNLAASYVSVFAAIEGGRRFLQTGMEFESLQAMMLGASGTAVQAGEDFNFVRDQALRLGLDLREATRGYAKLGIASSAAGFDIAQSRDLFLSVSEAARAFNLTPQRQQLVFLAFEQMLSKGKVSMEELRRQLGEQIPGAFQTAAKAMNMSTAELDQLVSSGKLASEDFLPKFAKELRKSVRDSGALAAAIKKVSAEQGRMIATLQLATKEGFEAGRGGIAGFFRDLGLIIRDNIPTFKAFGSILGGTLKLITVALRTVSPLVALVGNVFNSLAEAIKNSIDASKQFKDLTVFEVILRQIAKAVIALNIGILYLRMGFEKLAEWFGMSEDGLARFISQLFSFILVGGIVAKTFGWIYKGIKLLFAPLLALGRILSPVVKGLKTVAGAKVGEGVAAAAKGAATKGPMATRAAAVARGSLGGPLGIALSLFATEIIDAIQDPMNLIRHSVGGMMFESVKQMVAPEIKTESTVERKTGPISLTQSFNIKSDNPREVAQEIERMSQQMFSNAISSNI